MRLRIINEGFWFGCVFLCVSGGLYVGMIRGVAAGFSAGFALCGVVAILGGIRMGK